MMLPRLDARTIEDDDKLEDAVQARPRVKTCQGEIGKRPEVTVMVSRLMAV